MITSSSGPIITRVETFARDQVGLCRITCDDGTVGWGQVATFEAADLVARCLHRQAARVVLGRDAGDRGRIVQEIAERNLKFPGSYICRSMTAIETALLDHDARARELPVWQLLGGTGEPVPVYGSSMSRTITPDEEGRRLAKLRDRFGYRAFKIRVGSPAGHDVDAWPGRTEAIIPAVRGALGPDVTIHADANSGFSAERAIEVGRILEVHDYGHFEEPCPYWELDETRQVTEALTMPVAGGEQDNQMPVWKTMIRDHVVDIVQPDICYVGGIERTRQVAALAAEQGLTCVPHSANHSLVTIFTLHLWHALGNHGPFCEFSVEDQAAFLEMFEPALEVTDGVACVPDLEPGWGMVVSEPWLDGSEYLMSELDGSGTMRLEVGG